MDHPAPKDGVHTQTDLKQSMDDDKDDQPVEFQESEAPAELKPLQNIDDFMPASGPRRDLSHFST